MKQMRKIVEKAMDEITAQQDGWAGWGTVEYETASPAVVAGWYASYDKWTGCAGATLHIREIWIIYKDGTFAEVPYKYYSVRFAENHISDIEEEEDIVVGDYLTEGTVGVVVRDRDYEDVEGRDYEDSVRTVVYFLKPIPKREEEEIREKLIEKIKTMPIMSLFSLLERVGDYD